MNPKITRLISLHINNKIPTRLFFLFVCLLLTTVTLSGCTNGDEGEVNPSAGITYEIAPVFREFHAALGGEPLLGPAISQLFPYEDLECQYTVNALMCQNPVLGGANRYQLYPLGKAFDLQRGESGGSEGQIGIYEEFVPLFDQLSRDLYAGSPLTGVKINNAQQRIEQYFENVGFYRLLSDARGTVKLLAYGTYACDERCDFPPRAEAMLAEPSDMVIEQPFQVQLENAGIGSALGLAITQPYIANDGALEQVYMNAVVYSPVEKPDKVFLRSIAEQVGMTVETPGPRRNKKDKTIVFYEIKNGKGFYVPARVDKFVANHGGRKYSGDPIAVTTEVEAGVYRQCFTNYCVLYQPDAEKGEQVHMTALGLQYLEMIQDSIADVNPDELTSETVLFTLVEKHETLPAGEVQRIDITLLNRADTSPLAGIESTLTLALPDGTRYTTDIEATRDDGTTAIEIPPMKNVPNGSLLIYAVCLKTGLEVPVCAEGSYLTWQSP